MGYYVAKGRHKVGTEFRMPGDRIDEAAGFPNLHRMMKDGKIIYTPEDGDKNPPMVAGAIIPRSTTHGISAPGEDGPVDRKEVLSTTMRQELLKALRDGGIGKDLDDDELVPAGLHYRTLCALHMEKCKGASPAEAAAHYGFDSAAEVRGIYDKAVKAELGAKLQLVDPLGEKLSSDAPNPDIRGALEARGVEIPKRAGRAKLVELAVEAGVMDATEPAEEPTEG